MTEKHCSKCKELRDINSFGKLKSSKDGYRYDCNLCRKKYREINKTHIQMKQKEYYKNNKETLLLKNKEYRDKNIENINNQRKVYRNQEHIKLHIQKKNKEYLPIKKEKIKEKRRTDFQFRISEVLKSHFHRLINCKTNTYKKYLNCDVYFLKKWIEFQFDDNMTWSNYATYWHIDHILPISLFDFSEERNKYICFNWINLQPLKASTNISKFNKLQLHYYFNSIISVIRFNDNHKKFLGYQAINESLSWLRKNSGMVKIPRM